MPMIRVADDAATPLAAAARYASAAIIYDAATPL